MAQPLLHLLHMVSPALPIGAYAYSQGLESAIEQGWLNNESEIEEWLGQVLCEGVAKLDAPVLLRCHRALLLQDWLAVARWNNWILACRETRELLLEDQQLGIALQRLLLSLGAADADHSAFGNKPAFVSQFALACVDWGIDEGDAISGFCWSWLENQVAAATKIVPLGQTQAQKMLLSLMERIADASAMALTIEDEDMGISLPGVTMASATHEQQYSRLFRS